MRPNRVLLLAVALAPMPALAQDESYKVEALNEPPPASLAGPIKEALDTRGYRVLDGEGKPYLDFWLRKAVPASSKPAGPKGAVLFPFLTEGELLGAMRIATEGYDYRDQSIPAGAYTMRYGLQPVNGDHLGVSEYRDYVLLVPAAKDTTTGEIAQKQLESQSADAAGSTHPAVFLLRAGPAKAPDGPEIVHDETLNTWEVTVPLPLRVEGASDSITVPIRIVVVGSKV